jgi:hypothetical protein
MGYRMEQGGVGDPVISPEDWQLIFGGFDDVYRFQHRLLQELEAEWNSQVLVLRVLREQNGLSCLSLSLSLSVCSHGTRPFTKTGSGQTQSRKRIRWH